jgi:plasmid stabilization system protein ParE
MDEIWDYIYSELCSLNTAERTIGKIMTAIDRLADFPQLGPLLSSIAELESDYRFLVCGNYMVFYRVIGSVVYVDRVLYGRQNYIQTLFPDIPQDNLD